MSEIDLSKCCYYNADNSPFCCELYDNECEAQNCYFQQLQHLKAENEELKKGIVLECPQCGETYLNKIGCELYEEKQKYKQCLNEIEECIKCCATTLYGCVNCKKGDECNGALSDLILQLIKQAKEGEE